MLQKTEGIVLRAVKYTDTRLIVTIFTEAFGTKAYIVNASRAKKGNKNVMFYRAGMLLDLVVYERPKSSVQRIKEAGFAYKFSDLVFNPVKTAILFFITEVLGIVVSDDQPEPEMFRFVRGLLLLLDSEKELVHGYLYYFMIKMSRFLGFFPFGKYSDQTPIFDLANGVFRSMPPAHANYISGTLAEQFGNLLEATPENINQFASKPSDRLKLLEQLLVYYRLHYPTFKDVKSLEVMRQVFS